MFISKFSISSSKKKKNIRNVTWKEESDIERIVVQYERNDKIFDDFEKIDHIDQLFLDKMEC